MLCKFLLLFYYFRTKFQGWAKVLKGGKLPQGAPPAPLWEKARILLYFETKQTVIQPTPMADFSFGFPEGSFLPLKLEETLCQNKEFSIAENT